MAVMKIRHNLIGIIHSWFRKKNFIEIHAPILTQVPLYEDHTAFSLDFFGKTVFLTQCVAFYLEAAIFAFERVYNIGPTFRSEKSKGRRHLAEYWHVKAELAFSSLEDMIKFTEEMIFDISEELLRKSKEELKLLDVVILVDKLKPPYPKITYDEAITQLVQRGVKFQWSKSLGDDEEKVLSENFKTPFWVIGLPKDVEPFPYVIDSSSPKITRTADLLAPEGYGELLGVNEKIYKKEELIKRMKEKDKWRQIERYQWYLELRDFGCVPHTGFGMGIERFIRWLLKLPHVRDAIPFPRLYPRIPLP